ncbi:hypothetical protein [Pseudoalteromonas sp. OF7H-1]|uniref:hypothetical protein n=1 Tax=Pseudoalteromonas sp. OF7H-1 TaxID=2917755 RepID=UPI001EF48684|nr:hypothetical protein [Pseudoalteromonas sp. OF7H-1]MCG7540019.1 hypothetical protein [Pseudoalteromonas sp. OF7H-1]
MMSSSSCEGNRVDNRYFDSVDLFNFNEKRVAILAGHYCISTELSDLSNFSESEELSFKSGVEFHKKLKIDGVVSRLYLWVNDIGISPNERASIKKDFSIPSNYKVILENAGLSCSDIEVVFESSTRNKALKYLSKSSKANPDLVKMYDSNDSTLIRCVDNEFCDITIDKKAYAIDGPNNAPLVMREGSNPKCNLILATLFKSIYSSFESHFFINFFNDIYIERIELGIYVFEKVFGSNSQFINFFCDDDYCHLEETSKSE